MLNWVSLAASYADPEFANAVPQLAEQGIIGKSFLPYPNVAGADRSSAYRVYWNEHALQSYCGNQSRDILIHIVYTHLQGQWKRSAAKPR